MLGYFEISLSTKPGFIAFSHDLQATAGNMMKIERMLMKM